MSTRRIIAATSLITFLITSALWIAVLAFLYWSVNLEPPEFQIDIESPDEVALGDEFHMVISVTNISDSDLTLSSIDVYDSLLGGFELIYIDPTPEDKWRILGMDTSFFSRRLSAQETFTATYSLKAKAVGAWVGDIDCCTPFENFVTVSKAIRVTEQSLSTPKI